MADEKLRPPEQVAKLVLLHAVRRLEFFSRCDFCVAGRDDHGDNLHVEACPLFGYDMTPDLERLKAWAEGGRMTRANATFSTLLRRAQGAAGSDAAAERQEPNDAMGVRAFDGAWLEFDPVSLSLDGVMYEVSTL